MKMRLGKLPYRDSRIFPNKISVAESRLTFQKIAPQVSAVELALCKRID